MKTKPAPPPSVITPGPWMIDENANIYAEGEDGTVLIAYIYHRGNAEQSGRANARLIASLPTILEYIRNRASSGDPDAQQLLTQLKL